MVFLPHGNRCLPCSILHVCFYFEGRNILASLVLLHNVVLSNCSINTRNRRTYTHVVCYMGSLPYCESFVCSASLSGNLFAPIRGLDVATLLMVGGSSAGGLWLVWSPHGVRFCLLLLRWAPSALIFCCSSVLAMQGGLRSSKIWC